MASADQAGGGASSSSGLDGQTAYDDLKRLIPSLAAELELLRTSLREHSLWLLRYGHGGAPAAPQTAAPAASGPDDVASSLPPPSSSTTTTTTANTHNEEAIAQTSSLSSPPHPPSPSPSPSAVPTGPPPAFTEANDPPAYSASDVPPYTGGLGTVSASTREEVRDRRDQLAEWLREGEDVLREYSARYAQLAQALGMPQEDLLGTWHEAHPDNALPGYRQVEERDELMVGGVGEVPPPYLGGRVVNAGRGGGGGGGGDAAAAAGVGGGGNGGSGDPSSSSSSSKQEPGGQ